MTERIVQSFSAVGFAVAVVATGLGTAAGLTAVPVAGSYLGMLCGGLVAGLAVEKRPLVESGLAAVLTNLGVLASGPMIGNGPLAGLTALGAVAPVVLLITIALSFAIGVFGAHFGNDLRDGLTAPVETSPAGTERSITTPVGTESDPQTANESSSTENRDTRASSPAASPRQNTDRDDLALDERTDELDHKRDRERE